MAGFTGIAHGVADLVIAVPVGAAEWAGRSVDVLLGIYAKRVVGQDELARRRISEALRPTCLMLS
jgi:hypothetical protein